MANHAAVTRAPYAAVAVGDHVSWPRTGDQRRICGAVIGVHPNDGKPVARIALHDTRHAPTGERTSHFLAALTHEATGARPARETKTRAVLDDNHAVVVREAGSGAPKPPPPPRYTTPAPPPPPPPRPAAPAPEPAVNLTEAMRAALDHIIDSGRR